MRESLRSLQATYQTRGYNANSDLTQADQTLRNLEEKLGIPPAHRAYRKFDGNERNWATLIPFAVSLADNILGITENSSLNNNAKTQQIVHLIAEELKQNPAFQNPPSQGQGPQGPGQIPQAQSAVANFETAVQQLGAAVDAYNKQALQQQQQLDQDKARFQKALNDLAAKIAPPAPADAASAAGDAAPAPATSGAADTN